MAIIVNQNPPQPRVPDEIEQDLQNQINEANGWVVSALLSCVTYKVITVVLAYFLGCLDIQNPTFFDYYNMLMGFYGLFFILLPFFIGAYLQANMNTMKYAIYVFVAFDFVFLLIVLVQLYSNGIKPAMVNSSYIGNQITTYGLAVYHTYQWYIASKNLKLYQHGNRHRLSYVLNGIKGA